jgi:hypothetical protein
VKDQRGEGHARLRLVLTRRPPLLDRASRAPVNTITCGQVRNPPRRRTSSARSARDDAIRYRRRVAARCFTITAAFSKSQSYSAEISCVKIDATSPGQSGRPTLRH